MRSIILLTHLLSVGCNEYNLFNEDKNQDGELIPEISVQPQLVDGGTVCSEDPHEETIFIENVGQGPLLIEQLEITGDWVLLSDPTPVTINPSDNIVIPVLVGQVDSTLVIASNDPENDIVQVPLTSVLDESPTLEIIAPFDGQIISEETPFQALVTDDNDPTEFLMVQWRSNQDGLFSTGEAYPDGTVSTDWEMFHTSGYHTIQVTVADSCSNTTRKAVNICQQMRYEVENLDISTWHFEGVARWDSANEWLELTPVSTNIVGTAFSTSQEVPGGQVEIEFSFYIGDGTGADGISLTALDVDRMTSFLGGTGCGIGYGGDAPCTAGPALPGWSIEVDTYYNDGQDPTPEDHTMRVVVQEPHVLVEIDGVSYLDQDIAGFYNFDAYVGFTAGTGGLTNQHLIDSLVVTEQLCGD